MGETKAQKAERLLVTGRLTVTAVDPDARAAIVAEVKGDSGEMYALGYDREQDRWGCTCPANSQFRRECAHLKSLKLVTVKPKEDA